ncbi:MAG: hypothetical protein ACKV2O_16740 [Acidimicrobiales bacterium]
MADQDSSHERSEGKDKPSVKQLLHWATGDREAEGKALAERADVDVDPADAEEAVKRAHGDLGVKEDIADGDVAHLEDVETVAREKR